MGSCIVYIKGVAYIPLRSSVITPVFVKRKRKYAKEERYVLDREIIMIRIPQSSGPLTGRSSLVLKI